MAFFLSSISASIVKRLFLFTLSRLDILDQDPSDFVEVSVGKTSTLELRDVGIRVKRLSSLLQLDLPPEIRLEKAKVALLRLTLSLNTQDAGIHVEVEGVDILATLSSEEGWGPSRGKGRPGRPTKLSPRARDASNYGDLRDSTSSAEEDEHVPTAEDLAKSFLEEEPTEEREELEAAFHAQSRYMQESTLSSSDSDDESTLGIGTAPSLPAFLENFMISALDRSQATITNINVRLDAHVPQENAQEPGTGEPSLVSFNLHIAQAALDELSKPELKLDSQSKQQPEKDGKKDGKRCVSLRKIGASIVSDFELFENLQKLSRPTSPLGVRSEPSQGGKSAKSSVYASQKSKKSESLTGSALTHESRSPPEVPSSPHLEDSMQSSLQPSRVSYKALESEEDPMEVSEVTTDDDRFADASMYENTRPSRLLPEQTSGAGSTILSQGVGESALFEDKEFWDYASKNGLLSSDIEDLSSRGFEHPRNAEPLVEQSNKISPKGPATKGHEEACTVKDLAATTPIPCRPAPSTPPPTSQSQPLSPSPHEVYYVDNKAHALETILQRSHSPVESKSSQQELPRVEDLTESKVFTHEEAESMYLSAMSEALLKSKGDIHVPGGWDDASILKSEMRVPPLRTKPKQTSDEVTLDPQSVESAPIDEGAATPRASTPTATTPSYRSSSPEDKRETSFDGKPRVRRGDDRPSKTIFTVEEAALWVPWPPVTSSTVAENDDLEADALNLTQESPSLAFGSSTIRDLPGSFSQYAESTSLRRRKDSDLGKVAKDTIQLRGSPRILPTSPSAVHKSPPTYPTSPPTIARSPPRAHKSPATASAIPLRSKPAKGLDLEIGPVQMRVDVVLGMLLYRLTKEISRILEKPSNKTMPKKQAQITTQEKSFSTKFQLFVEEVSLAWYENLNFDSLAGSTPERVPSSPEHVILKAAIEAIDVRTTSSASVTSSKIAVGKLTFGTADSHIFSFDASQRMRHSVRDLKEPTEADISLEYSKTPQRAELNIFTLPILLNFDVQKLDESFSCFGGVSGVLELGNSITSSGNGVISPVKVETRPKGVHFDAPAKPKKDAVDPLKVQLRCGGCTVKVKGRSCSLLLQSTALKAAVRDRNVRLRIDKTKISGPFMPGLEASEAPLSLDLMDTQIEYLFTPEEIDLARLLSIITPSKDKYEDDDDILVDALLRQRKKGSLVRASFSSIEGSVLDLDQLQQLSKLGEELSKLSSVTKYLPDDDRPGILTLGLVERLDFQVRVSEQIGTVSVSSQGSQFAHVGFPFLLGLEVGSVFCVRGLNEVLIHEVLAAESSDRLPMLMARMVGDEIEPTLKLKLFNVCFEYKVPTLMALLGLKDDATTEDVVAGLASSVATITGPSSPGVNRQLSSASSTSVIGSKPLKIDLLVRDSALGLNPRGMPSKCLVVLTNTRFTSSIPRKQSLNALLEIRKTSILIIDDIGEFDKNEDSGISRRQTLSTVGSRQILELCKRGYVSISTVSSAEASINVKEIDEHGERTIEIDLRDDLFVLESCADSTQTVIATLNGLKPPMPKSTAVQYRTNIVPITNLMESFTGDAWESSPVESPEASIMDDADIIDDDLPTNQDFVGSFYNPESLPTEEERGDDMLEDDLDHLAPPPIHRKIGESQLLESFQEKYEIAPEEKIEFKEDYFGADSEIEGYARKWDSHKGQYGWSNEFKVVGSPLKVRVRDVHLIWNLFDGYDWMRTRDTIAQAVHDVEQRAEERRQKRRSNLDDDDDDIQIEEDYLFNSVWISVPISAEKGALAGKINHEIDDLVSETGSYATSTATRTTVRPRSSRSKPKRLKLERSKHHKITFEMRGVSADLVVFPPESGETQSSIDVRIRDFEIFDHVPSSTWKKFATYMHDAGERQLGKPMIHLEILNVRPVADLAASEIVLRATVLPLRLHVDQDALDFITRFFEFKDESAAVSSSKDEQPFLQRVEVNEVLVKLDYKPKKVDYAGLRSGRTKEFMNFFVLDGANIVLRHVIVYGIDGFDRLHTELNNIWTPDVTRNQIPQILAGLGMVRPLANVGLGFRDLVTVPIREYRRDGRLVRSVQKGATAFARTTTTELVRLGAKLAIGTQNMLQGAEGLLSPAPAGSGGGHSSTAAGSASSGDEGSGGWEDIAASDPIPRAVSSYANQPLGVRAGLRTAARSLERDLLTTRDAIIAIPGEVMESDGAGGAVAAVARRAPTVILRPAVGASRAIGQTLLGVGNALDRDGRRRVEDKYKNY